MLLLKKTARIKGYLQLFATDFYFVFFIDSTNFLTWIVGCMDASTKTFWFIDDFKDVDPTALANTCGSHFLY